MKFKGNHLSKLLLLFFISVSVASCRYSIDIDGVKGNGNMNTQTRLIREKFEKIEVDSGIDLIVTQSEVPSVVVETDDNIQLLITTKVENGVLIVSANSQYNTEMSPQVRVSLPFITGLSATSGATINNRNTLKSSSLAVSSTSGSEIKLNVEADYISMESSSGSELEVSGKALKAETSSTSGSSLEAGKLMANEVFAQVSSGSSTTVYPIVSLKAKASSGGSISYTNVPKKLEKEESSGGSIRQD
jgi:hypothetical protein